MTHVLVLISTDFEQVIEFQAKYQVIVDKLFEKLDVNLLNNVVIHAKHFQI